MLLGNSALTFGSKSAGRELPLTGSGTATQDDFTSENGRTAVASEYRQYFEMS